MVIRRVSAPVHSHSVVKLPRQRSSLINSIPRVSNLVRTCAIASSQPQEWKVSGATASDRWSILRCIVSEKLNPMSLDMGNFVVAKDSNGTLAGFGQLKPLEKDILELSSLVVLPKYRCRGLGKKLVAELLARVKPGVSKVFLITIRKWQKFYESCGFTLCPRDSDDVPFALRLEAFVGTPVARIAAGDNIIVMSWLKGMSETAVDR